MSENAVSEKMLAAYMGGTSFACCMCGTQHRGIDKGLDTVTECFYKLVREVGACAPDGLQRKRRSRNIYEPYARWRAADLTRIIWPESMGSDIDLKLDQYRHALAADTKEMGIAFLKSVIADWRAQQDAKENDLWASEHKPNIKVRSHRGVAIYPKDETSYNYASLQSMKTATLMFKDPSVASIASTVSHEMECVELDWPDVRKPARMLLVKDPDDDKAPKLDECYLLGKDYWFQKVPRRVGTIKEAEAYLTIQKLTNR
jgi:hypothetical protein